MQAKDTGVAGSSRSSLSPDTGIPEDDQPYFNTPQQTIFLTNQVQPPTTKDHISRAHQAGATLSHQDKALRT